MNATRRKVPVPAFRHNSSTLRAENKKELRVSPFLPFICPCGELCPRGEIPTDTCPLSRCNDSNLSLADRSEWSHHFRLFILGNIFHFFCNDVLRFRQILLKFLKKQDLFRRKFSLVFRCFQSRNMFVNIFAKNVK